MTQRLVNCTDVTAVWRIQMWHDESAGVDFIQFLCVASLQTFQTKIAGCDNSNSSVMVFFRLVGYNAHCKDQLIHRSYLCYCFHGTSDVNTGCWLQDTKVTVSVTSQSESHRIVYSKPHMH